MQYIRDRAAFLRQAVSFWIRRFWRLVPLGWLWLLIPVFFAIFLINPAYLEH